MQGYPPLKTMTIKIEPQFGPTPHVQGSLFQDLLGISRAVSVIFVHLGFSIMGFSLHYNKDMNHLVSENITLP